MIRRTALLGIALASLAGRASAQTFPARTGESGLLDVPDAEVVGTGAGLLAAELRLDRSAGAPTDFGPFPVYLTAGVLSYLEAGLVAREWGQPGDPRPARRLFGGAAKLRLIRGAGALPSVAIDATLDRIGQGEVPGTRLLLSTTRALPVRGAAFVGREWGRDPGMTFGGALAFLTPSDSGLIVEALRGPRGRNLGVGLRKRLLPTLATTLGFNYLPDDEGFRVSVGFGFVAAVPRLERPKTESAPAAVERQPDAPVAAGFLDDRPHFRLRIAMADRSGTEPRRVPYAPSNAAGPVAAASGSTPTAAPPVPRPPAGPSPEDVQDAQLAEQEARLAERRRRVETASEQLRARADSDVAEAQRLEAVERDLALRQQRLDDRERRARVRGAPTPQQRQLESEEAQLAARERQLQAEERGMEPALEAARGSELDAGGREGTERSEAERLDRALRDPLPRAKQLDLRTQATAARGRELAAADARLVAAAARLDAAERQRLARSERLDAMRRRLDARAERLDLLDARAAAAERAAAPVEAPAATPPATPPTGPAAPAQGKEKAVFVLVVKSPTAIVKEAAGGAAAAAPAPGAEAAPAGAVVERAVSAATVVMFPTPSTQLSELDLEAIVNVARQAERDRSQVLVWARAKDPSLMGEAQRRAAEVKGRIVAAAKIEERQIQTRITTRPGAAGVDVVVSALRAATPARGPAAEPASAPAGGGAASSETTKRQVREAVVAVQPAIEACVAAQLKAARVTSAQAVLKITVSGGGKVSRVAAGQGDIAGAEFEACLGRAAATWTFPTSDGEYTVDVPISIVGGKP